MKFHLPIHLSIRIFCVTLGLVFIIPIIQGCGSFWKLEDLEKPKPEFSKNEKKHIAKLIPRGKNNSVLISFESMEGEITSIKGIDFDTHKNSAVDEKDFRSALFEIKIEKLNPGQEVELVVGSEFFTTATEFWLHNPKRTPAWRAVASRSFTKQQIYVDLVFRIKDGGNFDLDGEQNGTLIIVGGPRDSFWGYALGTLFIRFFGVFIVLIALMIGMIFFGKLATNLKSNNPSDPKDPPKPTNQPKPPEAATQNQALPPTIAAAVALAIELESHRINPQIVLTKEGISTDPGPWAKQGRVILMESRQNTYERVKR